jgi:hypothetical protein
MAYNFNPFTGTFDDVGKSASGTYPPPTSSDTEVIFNNAGTLDGSADLTWDDTAKELGVGGDINLDDGGTYSTTLQMVTATANRTISFPDATGTVGLVAGSSGQVTYNSSGAYAGLGTVTTDGTNVTLTGRFISSLNGAASAPPGTFTGTWFTGGTATTTKPQVLIEPAGATSTAWSTSGTGLGVNASSGFTGNLLDLQVNGSQIFRVAQLGGVNYSPGITNTSFAVSGTAGTIASLGTGSGFIYYGSQGNHRLEIRTNNTARLKLDTVGSVEIATALTVATLPGTPIVGMIARVTDGDSGLTFGNTVVNSGAGATPYLCWYNGTNWTVIGA